MTRRLSIAERRRRVKALYRAATSPSFVSQEDAETKALLGEVIGTERAALARAEKRAKGRKR